MATDDRLLLPPMAAAAAAVLHSLASAFPLLYIWTMSPTFDIYRQTDPVFSPLLIVPFVLRLYGPRLIPFLRSLRTELTHVSAIPYLIQRGQGLASSHFLQAFWQFAMYDWRTVVNPGSDKPPSQGVSELLTACVFDLFALGLCVGRHRSVYGVWNQVWKRRQSAGHDGWDGGVHHGCMGRGCGCCCGGHGRSVARRGCCCGYLVALLVVWHGLHYFVRDLSKHLSIVCLKRRVIRSCQADNVSGNIIHSPSVMMPRE